MAKSNNQKAKILFLEQMLRETGENHVVSMQEILSRLAEHGIAAERKSIYDDMDALRAFGMDVRFHRGKPGGYYLAGRNGADIQIRKKQTDIESDNTDADQKENVSSLLPVKELDTGCSLNFRKLVRSGEKKRMILFCEIRREKQIRAYFGKTAEITTEEPGLLVVEAPLSLDPQFFGWVTAMGGDVRLRKPKKLAQTYREYLKTLAKEYKGIGKKEE